MNAHTLNIIINYQLPPVEITNYTAPLNATLPNFKTGNTRVRCTTCKQFIKETLCYFHYDTYPQEEWKSGSTDDGNARGPTARVSSPSKAVLPNTFKTHLVVSL